MTSPDFGSFLGAFSPLYKREMRHWFQSPFAVIFLCIFLLAAGAFPIFLGNFFGTAQANLSQLFVFMPWLLLVLIPALSMRVWADERRSGTIELLMTLPVTTTQVVFAKFFAVWTVVAIGILGTFPIWITVNWLGSPDNGVIMTQYVAATLLGGAYTAIGCLISMFCRQQTAAFVSTLAVCFVLTLTGSPLIISAISEWAPPALIALVANISLLHHFQLIGRGVIDVGDMFYYLFVILFALALSIRVLSGVTAK
ncbi:MAG: ABC transporter permease subunit [Alphaproteobacteria bacterium]|nr:ABC transporter permease subunit [Alphaproteobacteria bacterium]